MRNRAAYAILWGGLIAGLIDITYAIGFSATRGVPPIRILQSVASGLLGSSSYQGGATTATLGLILHFVPILLITSLIVHAFGIGVPIALASRKAQAM